MCYEEGPWCSLFSSLYSLIMNLWCREKLFSLPLVRHELEWYMYWNDVHLVTPQPQLLFLSYFLGTSCFSPPSSWWLCPSPLHRIQSLPLFLIFHFSYFWMAWWEKMPVPSNLHLFCNDLRLWLFSLMSYSFWSVITTYFLASTAHDHSAISCGGSLAGMCTWRWAAALLWLLIHYEGMFISQACWCVFPRY